jgi:hypothetical protein
MVVYTHGSARIHCWGGGVDERCREYPKPQSTVDLNWADTDRKKVHAVEEQGFIVLDDYHSARMIHLANALSESM